MMCSGWSTLTDSKLYENYIEAVTALSTIEHRQREALRKAVETATSAEGEAKTHVANQQRMYDRALRDALDAERLLAELRSMLGVP